MKKVSLETLHECNTHIYQLLQYIFLVLVLKAEYQEIHVGSYCEHLTPIDKSFCWTYQGRLRHLKINSHSVFTYRQ